MALPVPNLPAKFEKEVERLGLTPEKYVESSELRVWCERNKNRFYIPEWLLETWGLTVETIIDKTIQRLIPAS